MLARTTLPHGRWRETDNSSALAQKQTIDVRRPRMKFAGGRYVCCGNKITHPVSVARSGVPASDPAIPEQNLVRLLPVSAAQCYSLRVHKGEPERSTQSKVGSSQITTGKAVVSRPVSGTTSITTQQPIKQLSVSPRDEQRFCQHVTTKK